MQTKGDPIEVLMAVWPSGREAWVPGEYIRPDGGYHYVQLTGPDANPGRMGVRRVKPEWIRQPAPHPPTIT